MGNEIRRSPGNREFYYRLDASRFKLIAGRSKRMRLRPSKTMEKGDHRKPWKRGRLRRHRFRLLFSESIIVR